MNDDSTPVATGKPGKPGMALEVQALAKTFVGRARSSVAIGEGRLRSRQLIASS